MTYVTNRQRIISLLRKSKRGYTAFQISDKLDMDNVNSVYAAVSKLSSEGYTVQKTPGADGILRYSMA